MPPEQAIIADAEAWQSFERSAEQLPNELRTVLASEWARAAQFEHASIASFNRFSLELLALGAAAELIQSTNQAAIEEVEHARLSFAIASVYAGAQLGPAPLPLAGLDFSHVELAAVAHGTALDGCVNETLAAAEADAAHRNASNPVVRAVLARIARDEARHAALACQFVRWASAIGGAPVRTAAREGFLLGVQQARGFTPSDRIEPLALGQHGRLSAAERQSVRLTTVTEVLAPLAAELFA